MVISIVILVAGIRLYRFQEPMGSPFTRFVQVMWASVRNHLHGVQVGHQTELYEVNTNESDIKGAQKLSHTIQYSFLDKAAVVTDPEADTRNRWRLCTVTQVEEFKSFIRILPVWACIHNYTLHILCSALNLLHQPSKHHGPKTRLQLHNSSRFCPHLQRQQCPHSCPRLRKSDSPCPP
ncbi:hypothetical protein NC652_014824 [Populus alba x Populus x berolinensis]|nr:hypothetical protein NC652_014824 [Populus alba x Populus x berolinensis]